MYAQDSIYRGAIENNIRDILKKWPIAIKCDIGEHMAQKPKEKKRRYVRRRPYSGRFREYYKRIVPLQGIVKVKASARAEASKCRICTICSKLFYIPPGRWNQKVCPDCKRKEKEAVGVKICDWCHEPFMPKRRDANTCSPKCRKALSRQKKRRF